MEFSATLAQLPRMLGFIRNNLNKDAFSKEKIYHIELVAEEALVNVISYAYPEKKGSETVKIACHMHQTQFELIIEDQGVAFNPLDAKKPDIDQPLSMRQIGGLGIFLMQRLSQAMHYQRHDNKNILTIYFNLE